MAMAVNLDENTSLSPKEDSALVDVRLLPTTPFAVGDSGDQSSSLSDSAACNGKAVYGVSGFA